MQQPSVMKIVILSSFAYKEVRVLETSSDSAKATQPAGSCDSEPQAPSSAPGSRAESLQGCRGAVQGPVGAPPFDPVPFQTKIFPSLPWSRMKQSSDLKAPWAKGFSSATRETDMVPAPLETWGMRGGPGPMSDPPHLGLPTGAP